jgi:hypothetical protein
VSWVDALKSASMPIDDAVMSAMCFMKCRNNRNQRRTYNAHSDFRGQLCLLDEQMSLAVQEDSRLTRIRSFRALQYISRLSPRPGTRVLWRGRTAPLCDENGGLAHQFLDLVPLVIDIVNWYVLYSCPNLQPEFLHPLPAVRISCLDNVLSSE